MPILAWWLFRNSCCSENSQGGSRQTNKCEVNLKQSCFGRLTEGTNIKNPKMFHCPMTWCQVRGIPGYLAILRPPMGVLSCPQGQPAPKAMPKAVLNQPLGREGLTVRVRQAWRSACLDAIISPLNDSSSLPQGEVSPHSPWPLHKTRI